MSEEKKIEERHKGQGTGDKEDSGSQVAGEENLQSAVGSQQLAVGSQQSSSTEEKPGTSNLKPETSNLPTGQAGIKPQTEEMEVHKHPHHVTHKKKWGEYLLEFLMLFLAVFLGFLAENFREHQVEKQRAKQYILSFCEDLKKDTARINDLLKYDDEKIAALNGMYSCYDTVLKNLQATSCMGPLVKHSRSNRSFVLTERTIRQLANAGGYRLLNKDDADRIIAYENVYRGYLDFQSTVFQSSQDNVRNTLSRIANFKVVVPLQLTTTTFAGDTLEGKLSGPLFFVADRALINQWFNELALYLRTTNGQRNLMARVYDQAVSLLKFYNDKYHFE